ncbi:MAG: heavy metal translocating P-type ATPase [Eubacteriales bacterium]|nr:heavy metal translocating P-type ATPase [Eubacteriales bacterium]
MEKEHKIKLIRIFSSVLLLAAAIVAEHIFMPDRMWLRLMMYLPAYLVAGYDVLIEAVEGIFHGEVFGEEFLMCIATVGALVIGFLPGADPEFMEAVLVMMLFQIGELFEDIAEDKSRRAISGLMDIRPDFANVERDGEIVRVMPDEVAVGDIIVVLPGERIPMDGIIIEGQSALDTVALTGESQPRDVDEEDGVFSGCVNLSGVLRIRVTKLFGESTATKILELVENAGERKSKSESFITKFAHYYTPTVVIAALLISFVPPLFSGDFSGQFAIWLARALTFLVVSCPCALVISVPLTFFGGIGGASRRGILIKGGNYVEALAKIGTVVFDKTGTLTQGVFAVSAVHPNDIAPEQLLHLAAHVERFSTHPIALSLRQAYGHETDDCQVSDVTEIAGQGVTAKVNGLQVSVGNQRLMESLGAEWKPCHHVGTIIHVAIDGKYAGHIVISDVVKPDSAQAVHDLEAAGVSHIVMLTGDRREVAEKIANDLSIKKYHAELLPADKVDKVESLLAAKNKNELLAFVGDGINDAPVLARADVGIAMGAMGSDAAVEAADVVIMDDKPSRLVDAIRIARQTLSIARQNIVFALTVKLAVLILAALGLAPMWLAVFADVGVTVIAVLNAMRTLK